jgi:hypothetical protein
LAFKQNFDLEIAEHRSDTPQPSNTYDAEIDRESGYGVGANASFNAHRQWCSSLLQSLE